MITKFNSFFIAENDNFDTLKIDNVVNYFEENFLNKINKSIPNKEYNLNFMFGSESIIGTLNFDFVEIELNIKYNFVLLKPLDNFLDNTRYYLNDKNLKQKIENRLIVLYLLFYIEIECGMNKIIQFYLNKDKELTDVCDILINHCNKHFLYLLNRDVLPTEYFNKYKYLVDAKNFDLI